MKKIILQLLLLSSISASAQIYVARPDGTTVIVGGPQGGIVVQQAPQTIYQYNYQSTNDYLPGHYQNQGCPNCSAPEQAEWYGDMWCVHLQFKADSYNVGDFESNYPTMANVNNWIQNNMDSQLVVTAYADKDTPYHYSPQQRHEYNYTLAQKRAEAVKHFFIKYYKVPSQRIVTVVKGDMEQRYGPNDDNRCVVLSAQ